MFRKLTDKLSAAANAVIGNSEEEAVQTLQQMGFSADSARNALQATNGDVDRAADLLLASVSPGGSQQQNAPSTTPRHNDNEAALNAALQESLQTEEARQLDMAREASHSTANNETKKPPPVQSAASIRAGQTAVARAARGDNPFPANTAKNGVQPLASHPNVKMPAKLQHKSKEEQVLRCADRMRPYPRAVDTLYIVLTSIQKDPTNDKFRNIDKQNAPSLSSAGAEDMCLAMNFTARSPTKLVLSRDRVDPALLYLGISALEGTRQTHEYKLAKRTLQFEKQIKTMLSQVDASESEAIQRANHMSKTPTEPSEGRGALVQVKIVDQTVRRRFDGDDTLEDVLYFLGGHLSVIPEKILSREWSLIDMNRYPLAPIDCEVDRHRTLQYIGCWPSGRLEVVPSAESWHVDKRRLDDSAPNSGNRSSIKMGSSRGLGAASSNS